VDVLVTSALKTPDKAKKASMALTSEYIIAKYIRLSLDDGVTESLSIPNQHMILDAYIDELESPNATVICSSL